MNQAPLSSPLAKPSTRPTFWGRHNELQTIYKYLLSQPPQWCAIVGETSFGKTTLLQHLSEQDSFILDDTVITDHFIFVYLDCNLYTSLPGMEANASAQFWWDLYSGLWYKLYTFDEQPPLSRPRAKAQVSIDDVLEIKLELEDLLQTQKRTVVFVLDNFEGVAHLPPRDSEWLRSLVRFPCACVVASRHLLYLLYQFHQESWATPSPLWNLFADPIYLGLISEQEVQDFLAQMSKQAEKLGSHWKQQDIDFIRRFAGRHPELMRIACTQLFEQRLTSDYYTDIEQEEFLKISISEAGQPVCDLLWRGLADPELWNVHKIAGKPGERETKLPSPYQQALIRLANGEGLTDKNAIFVLEQRGLIERSDGKWRIFSQVMHNFVLELVTSTDTARRKSMGEMEESTGEGQQRSNTVPTTHIAGSVEHEHTFTFLEGKAYEYLKAHIGQVCDREDIKRAVWEGDSPPSNSALQKIIERMREKIEPDPENPRYLIAARGQGYILREEPPTVKER